MIPAGPTPSVSEDAPIPAPVCTCNKTDKVICEDLNSRIASVKIKASFKIIDKVCCR